MLEMKMLATIAITEGDFTPSVQWGLAITLHLRCLMDWVEEICSISWRACSGI